MNNSSHSSTTRFSNRVENYSRYRPSYPSTAVDWLIAHYGLSPTSRIADVGSGTGIFTHVLMSAGLPVVAIEPNEDMRLESDRLHSHNPLYASMSGTAEATSLESASVDMVVAAQSFHWFNPETSKLEFQRILRPEGVLALIWNRRESTSTFQSEYETLLHELPEYARVKHTRLSDSHLSEFCGSEMERVTFPYCQKLDKAGFSGRVFSSSYTPSPGDANYISFSQKIDDLFARHSSNGILSLTYSTEIYAGQLR